MSLMTKEQYLESLSKIGHRVFIQGKQVVDVSKNPIAAPGAMAMAETYQQAFESPDLFTAKSHHPYSAERAGLDKQGSDAAGVGPQNSVLFSTLRRYGRHQLGLRHHP